MVNLQLWSQMAPQCTTSGQSHSPLPRQQKWPKGCDPHFVLYTDITCTFGGESHGTCSGSFHTEGPATITFFPSTPLQSPLHNISHTCLLENFNLQALTQTNWTEDGGGGRCRQKSQESVLLPNYTGWFLCSEPRMNPPTGLSKPQRYTKALQNS